MIGILSKSPILRDWITGEQASQLRAINGMQGADKSQIWRWAERGYIAHIRVGKKPLFSEAQILAFEGPPMGKPRNNAPVRATAFTGTTKIMGDAFKRLVRETYPHAAFEEHIFLSLDKKTKCGIGYEVWINGDKIRSLGVYPIS